uniref:PX domain-containing protein n=1 Tax=Setaria italica TaxID=4555 RepID=K3Z3A6_SETIT
MATTAAGAPRAQTLRDLADEGKKRAVLLLVFAFGLAFLMSLTSSSVWFNLPFATALIILFRYISLDYDLRRKSTTNTDQDISRPLIKTRSTELKKVLLTENDGKSNWRSKVNSPPVEAAFEQFSRHLVTEWVTDLWYSRVTPDKEGPEELITIVNTVLGEISVRARNVNLISLLTRDLVDLICNSLELYHFCQAKIGKEKFVNLPSEHRDAELKMALLAENKLHPALFSANAEYRVLQSLADGLISITVKPQDLQCTFFRCTARELLACAVLRPVMNLVNPRFINERIESLALSRANKLEKGVEESMVDATTVKQKEASMPSIDEFSASIDHSSPGVELVPFHQGQSKMASDMQPSKSKNSSSLKPESSNASLIGTSHPLESTSLHSTSHVASGNGFSLHSKSSDIASADSHGRERAQPLGISSQRTHQALALEHLENMWTKGKNYKSENAKHNANIPVGSDSLGSTSSGQQSVPCCTSISQRQALFSQSEDQRLVRHSTTPAYSNGTNHLPKSLSADMAEHAGPEDFGVESESSYATEDDDVNNVTGLDSPVTRVWESKSKGNATSSHIHHPLESSSFHRAKKNRSHVGKLKMSRTSSGRKRSRSYAQKPPIWQEERSSFTVGDDLDILNASANDSKTDELVEDTEVESMARMFSSANASIYSLASTDSSYSSNYGGANVLQDSYLKLRCEISLSDFLTQVVGASIVKSGSGMFAVYSISVTDANGNSWSIKRRFRHFEELHRRLKEYAQYNLHLPPKHFLSSGLEVPVVRERCKLLDIYLKNLLQIPIVSSCIEVWDFLSVDSQTYIFMDSLSVIQTLSVGLDERSNGKSRKVLNSSGALNGSFISGGQSFHGHTDNTVHKDLDFAVSDGLRYRKGNVEKNLGNSVCDTTTNLYLDNSGSDPEQNDYSFSIDSVNPKKMRSSETNETPQLLGSDGFSVSPNDWMAPNLSVPLFHLVDVVFQLQDGGWIRRQAFWVAKQLLQLGMGDTFDDWLVDKIQLLRKGRIIAFAVKRVEQILWPDGIFMTKHPNRKTSPPPSGEQNNGVGNYLSDEQRLEAARRANFVRELIIDKAPSPLVSLVGRKDYEKCAQDIYFFLQSPVCLKQLAFELLELLVLAAFPELDGTVRKWHEDKQRFGAQ